MWGTGDADEREGQWLLDEQEHHRSDVVKG